MYDYQTEKPRLFTEDGSVMFTQIRDRAKALLAEAGAFSMGAAIRTVSGDSWVMLACVDRMVELGELVEVTDPAKTPGQCRIFREARTR